MAVYEKHFQQESEEVQLIISKYKTKQCTSLIQIQNNLQFNSYDSRLCTTSRCFDYHSLDEKRRPPFDEKTHMLLYQPYPCTSCSDETVCLDGDTCKLCHSQNEINFHPLKYKLEQCIGCMLDNMVKLCSKYHPGEENRSNIINSIKMIPKAEKKKESMLSTIKKGKLSFDLEYFKTKPCQNKAAHNPKFCLYYHHLREKKTNSPI